MAVVTIPWKKGSGNITLSYNGEGDDTIVITSDVNELTEDREQTITLRTTAGNPVCTATITVGQKAGRGEILILATGEPILLVDGDTIVADKRDVVLKNIFKQLYRGSANTSVADNVVTITPQDKDTYFSIDTTEPLVVGEKYKVTCEANGVESGVSYMFNITKGENIDFGLYVYGNGVTSSVFTAADTQEGVSRFTVGDALRKFPEGAAPFTLSNFRVEKIYE